MKKLARLTALLLTGALLLALTICLYQRYHTLDLDKISLKIREKEE